MDSIKIKVLQELFKNKSKYHLNDQDGHTGIPEGYYDGAQGEYNEVFKFYRHPEMPDNLFLRETYHTDSYGESPSVVNIEFVEGKAKTITIYEPV